MPRSNGFLQRGSGTYNSHEARLDWDSCVQKSGKPSTLPLNRASGIHAPTKFGDLAASHHRWFTLFATRERLLLEQAIVAFWPSELLHCKIAPAVCLSFLLILYPATSGHSFNLSSLPLRLFFPLLFLYFLLRATITVLNNF
jgi:hypothetical protein